MVFMLESLKVVFRVYVLDCKFVILKKLFHICWLGRLDAVEAVVRSYDVLVLYFDDLCNTNVTAEGLAKQLRSCRFVVTLHFLMMCLLHLVESIELYYPCAAQRIVQKVRDAIRSCYLGGTIR